MIPSHRKTHRFTMLEVLVVAGTVLVLAAMLLNVFSKSRQKANYTKWLAYATDMQKGDYLVGHWIFSQEDEAANLLHNHARGLQRESYLIEDYHGTAIGTPLWTDGRWQHKVGMTFPASSAIEIPYVLDVTKDHSYFVWFKPKDSNTFQYLLQQADSGRLWLATSGDMTMLNKYAGSDQTSDTEMAIDTWHLLAVTYDADTNELSFYLDGELDGTTTVTPEESDDPVYFGNNKLLGTVACKGTIDEIAIYERILSETEIRNAYSVGFP